MVVNKKTVGFMLLAVFLIMQFIRPSREVPKVQKGMDFIEAHQPPEDIKMILNNACYDCHSFKSKYPWYSNIAPVSYWLSSHINEAREELNFSEWGTYPLKKKNHKLEEIGEEVKEHEMPLNSYTWIHQEAKLTDEQRAKLESYAKSLMVEETE